MKNYEFLLMFSSNDVMFRTELPDLKKSSSGEALLSSALWASSVSPFI